MTEGHHQDVKVIQFAPERWGQVDRFQRFYRTTYSFDKRTVFAVRGVGNQYHRAARLLSLTKRLAPTLQEDREELETKGFSSALRSAELAAIVEAFFSGLYSSVDCARQVVSKIYGDLQGVTSKSTRRFFQNAADGKLDAKVPAGIRAAFTNAPWYSELRRIRDAVIHSDVGSCHLNDESGEVYYMHSGLSTGNRAMVVEDVICKMAETARAVNRFLGMVFSDLNNTLEDRPVWQVCGIFGGRVYSRYVRPSEAVDFNGGTCDAFRWFESPENPTCPFAETCGAYKRAKDST